MYIFLCKWVIFLPVTRSSLVTKGEQIAHRGLQGLVPSRLLLLQFLLHRFDLLNAGLGFGQILGHGAAEFDHRLANFVWSWSMTGLLGLPFWTIR